MSTKPATVEQYLESLPPDRREAIDAIRKAINKNLDPAFEEGIQYGMVGWYVPHSVYPDGYHCDPSQPLPFASVASQKGHIGIYLFCLYFDGAEQERFARDWKATGKRLDMGKSCVRVKKLEDVPLDVLGRAIKRLTAKKFIGMYEAGLGPSAKRSNAKGAKVTKKAGAKKKAAAKKSTRKAGADGVSKKTTKKAPRKAASKKKAVSKKKTVSKKKASSARGARRG